MRGTSDVGLVDLHRWTVAFVFTSYVKNGGAFVEAIPHWFYLLPLLLLTLY